MNRPLMWLHSDARSDPLVLKLEHLYQRSPLLENLRNRAEAEGRSLALVGGAVRDLLLAKAERLDLDLLYDGDLQKLSAELASQGYRVQFRPRYLNLTLYTPGLRLDIGNPRSDQYETPGGKPRILPASMAEDLARRDFTINAMLLYLTPDEGRLYDPFKGREDLEARLLRPLFPTTLEEDPIRILRGFRYEVRFQLTRRGAWDKALERATSPSFWEGIAPGRLWHEFQRIGDEDQPWEILRLLEESGIARSLFGFPFSPALLSEVQGLGGLLAQEQRHTGRRWLGIFLLLLARVPSLWERSRSFWRTPTPELRRVEKLLRELLSTHPHQPLAQNLALHLREAGADPHRSLVALKEILRS